MRVNDIQARIGQRRIQIHFVAEAHLVNRHVKPAPGAQAHEQHFFCGQQHGRKQQEQAHAGKDEQQQAQIDREG